jgi:hypothetical protein
LLHGCVNLISIELVSDFGWQPSTRLFSEPVREQDRRIREQEITITDLKKEMETVVARLKGHDSKFERVSDQLHRSPSELQMVQNR